MIRTGRAGWAGVEFSSSGGGGGGSAWKCCGVEGFREGACSGGPSCPAPVRHAGRREANLKFSLLLPACLGQRAATEAGTSRTRSGTSELMLGSEPLDNSTYATMEKKDIKYEPYLHLHQLQE
ncbi:unnamed protein product, partial [Pleuronectes platessa]